MVRELKGVGRSAPNARDRRTNAASAYPPGVMLMPRKRIVIGLSICLLNTCSGCWLDVGGESCNERTAFFNTALFDAVLFTDLRSATSPCNATTAFCC